MLYPALEMKTNDILHYRLLGINSYYFITKLEGAREIAYLRQLNFYRRPLLAKFLRGHVRTVPGNMHVKFEVRSFNRFAAICY